MACRDLWSQPGSGLSFWISLLLMNLSLVSPLTQKVLLVSFDGFRWDYLDFIPGLQHFHSVAANGSSADYMNNTFATMTFPTHYSMATGLYQESHGIVSNYMWDPVFKEDFWPGCQRCLDQRWWGGEPIWITAVKQGRKAGCMFWPGTEVVFDGLLPTFVEKYEISTPFEDRADTVLDWFSNDDIDLGMVYFHEPDKAGHKYGPRSSQVRDKVQYVDGVLGYLMDGIRDRGLENSLNTIIVSDHGLANMTYDRVIEVPLYVNFSLLEKFVEVGAVCHVYPKEGLREEVFRQLDGAHPHMTPYRREDVPAHWHYSNNRRIGDILLVIDEHWSCTEDKTSKWNLDQGNHGYDNRLMSMKPIFLATGPDIKKGHKVKPFMSLDIYPLTARLLDIRPAPNNGTLDIVGGILREYKPVSVAVRSSGSRQSLEVVSVSLLCGLVVTVITRTMFLSG